MEIKNEKEIKNRMAKGEAFIKLYTNKEEFSDLIKIFYEYNKLKKNSTEKWMADTFCNTNIYLKMLKQEMTEIMPKMSVANVRYSEELCDTLYNSLSNK